MSLEGGGEVGFRHRSGNRQGAFVVPRNFEGSFKGFEDEGFSFGLRGFELDSGVSGFRSAEA